MHDTYRHGSSTSATRAGWLKRAISTGVLLAVVTVSAWAQGLTGTVTGTVKDATGGVVPGATVVLISEGQKTRTSPVVTNAQGDFVVANINAETYTVQVEMPSFKTLIRQGVSVGPGSRISVGTLTIEVGGASETVTVTSEVPVIQTTSGERSFRVEPDAVASLPLANRSYDALLALAPGVESNPGNLTPATRTGSGAGGNFMLDGATTMDPGVNRPAARVSVEAVAEVKVLTSSYQAEYGRSSGLQINAVTKSGTNQFHGSLYDVENKSKWGANRKDRIILNQPKPVSNSRDWGFAFGGPVGRPGGANKLFFYFNQEFNPREQGGGEVTARFPTDLERKGDFSQSYDQNGAIYNLIKDPSIAGGTCSATVKTGCFQDGGVVGKIPANRLYAPGIAILNWYPKPNLAAPAVGSGFNYQALSQDISIIGWQPILRVDYQPVQNIRGSFKYLEYQQPNSIIPGDFPGWNDSRQDDYGIYSQAATLNWTLNSTTFVEASYGHNTHHQEGCSISGGSPNFCDGGHVVNPSGSRVLSGFGDLPLLFNDPSRSDSQMKIDPNTFSYRVLNKVTEGKDPSYQWDRTTGRVTAVPTFAFGNRVSPSPPNNVGPFGNFLLDTGASNLNVTLTKVQGSHTLKVGYYYLNSVQKRGQGNFVGSISFANNSDNPNDTTFGFANAAIGSFLSYAQQSRWGEGAYTMLNHEVFVQDNWKVNSHLTLDYGMRFVHQVPQFDGYHKNANFIPEKWDLAQAPQLYVPACVAASPCTGSSRRAKNPVTGALLPSNQTAAALGTLVAGTGQIYNGVFGTGNHGFPNEGVIADTAYLYPTLGYAPRVGGAWDIRGDQRFVIRGGGGLFFDRPASNTVYNTVNNPPYTRNVTVRYGLLGDLSTAGLQTEGAPNLTVFQYEIPLPKSAQWNAELQSALPYALTASIAYTGSRDFDTLQGVNINNIDLGKAYDPALQDATTALNGTNSSLVNTNVNQVRFYRGFGSITQQQPNGWRKYHSIQWTLNRQFRNGFRFGFNNTINLSDKSSVGRRLQHDYVARTITTRADQGRANELLGNNAPRRASFSGNFTWQLPRLVSDSTAMRSIGYVVNDWSLSGIWTAATGTPYQVTYSYTSGGGLPLTGSPDYTARVIVLPNADFGAGGCNNADVTRQFNTAAFAGPQANSDGLESGNGYLTGCFQSKLDISLARVIKLGGSKQVQLRVDMFNALNEARITGRGTSMTLPSPAAAAATSATNLPYDAAGNPIAARVLPNGGGFGVASGYQAARTVQVQVRFQF